MRTINSSKHTPQNRDFHALSSYTIFEPLDIERQEEQDTYCHLNPPPFLLSVVSLLQGYIPTSVACVGPVTTLRLLVLTNYMNAYRCNVLYQLLTELGSY